MIKEIHKIYVVEIYNGNQLLYTADTSESLFGAKFTYDLVEIKKTTGKWPTKIVFKELEKLHLHKNN